MTDYIASGTDLTAVANAIRTKGSTSASLAFPSGFVTAINNISGGGGIQGGYNVTFKVSGSDYAIVSCVAGKSIASPQIPVVAGYHFNGWATTSGASTADVVFPYTPIADTTLYAVLGEGQGATITGLGSQTPSNVTFNVDSNFFTNVVAGEVTLSGSTFIRFNKVYRKINTTSDGQITSISLADTKIDNTYSIYPVFLKEDGVTEIDYVLMGKYCTTSSSTANSISGTAVDIAIGTGRTLCKARGTGYQQMDWMFFKLWQDLLIAKMQTVNTNSGSGIQTDQLGVCWYQGSNYIYPWIDGVAVNSNQWLFSYKPSAYIDSATASSTDYNTASYAEPTTSAEISKLGYDSAHPFFNYPSEVVSNSSYDTYYCDYFWYSSGSHPVLSYVGYANANNGAFRCNANPSWSAALGVRLCYRPLTA